MISIKKLRPFSRWRIRRFKVRCISEVRRT